MPNVFVPLQIKSSARPSAPVRNADLAFLRVFFSVSFFSQFGIKAQSRLPLTALRKAPTAPAVPPGEVEGAFCAALRSFSSAAHLVGYYAEEMESIAER